jgi:hypothetical protein
VEPPPAVRPPLGDVRDADATEGRSQHRLQLGADVGDQLQPIRALDLLEPGGYELEQSRAGLLGPFDGNVDRDAPDPLGQRNADRIRSKRL